MYAAVVYPFTSCRDRRIGFRLRCRIFRRDF